MNVLVTGAAGFVGLYLVEELRRTDRSVRLFGLGRNAESLERLRTMVGLEPVPADLLDPASVASVVREVRPDRVYHLAGHAAAAGDRDEIFQSNVEGTAHLLDALASLERPARVLVAGTGYVYGPCREDSPASEESPLRPQGDYAESKAKMERLALGDTWPAHLSICVARAFNHTGPGQPTRYVVPSLARQVALLSSGGGAAVEAGNLSPRRDFLDVRDVVLAYRLLMDAPWERAVVNVCSGTAVSIAEILAMLGEIAGVEAAPRSAEARRRASDLEVVVGTPRRLEEWTGWRRRIPLRQTLTDTLQWWRNQAGAAGGSHAR